MGIRANEVNVFRGGGGGYPWNIQPIVKFIRFSVK